MVYRKGDIVRVTAGHSLSMETYQILTPKMNSITGKCTYDLERYQDDSQTFVAILPNVPEENLQLVISRGTITYSEHHKQQQKEKQWREYEDNLILAELFNDTHYKEQANNILNSLKEIK